MVKFVVAVSLVVKLEGDHLRLTLRNDHLRPESVAGVSAPLETPTLTLRGASNPAAFCTEDCTHVPAMQKRRLDCDGPRGLLLAASQVE